MTGVVLLNFTFIFTLTGHKIVQVPNTILSQKIGHTGVFKRWFRKCDETFERERKDETI